MVLLLFLLKEMIIELIFGMSKNEATNLLKNANLDEKIGTS